MSEQSIEVNTYDMGEDLGHTVTEVKIALPMSHNISQHLDKHRGGYTMIGKLVKSEIAQRELIISITACTLTKLSSDLLSPAEGELISC